MVNDNQYTLHTSFGEFTFNGVIDHDWKEFRINRDIIMNSAQLLNSVEELLEQPHPKSNDPLPRIRASYAARQARGEE